MDLPVWTYLIYLPLRWNLFESKTVGLRTDQHSELFLIDQHPLNLG